MQESKICVKIGNMRKIHRKKKSNLKKILAVAAGILFLTAVLLAAGIFHVDQVDVTGNSYYTEEEITQMVIGEHKNSLYLFFLYDYLDGKEIPFVDSVEVSVVSPSHVKIRVYEKNIIGYVEYMGSNLYFDKDGTVVESSKEVLEGIPCIHGLKFDTLTLYQQLEVKNEGMFDILLSVTKMMEKYELDPDGITLQKEGKEIQLTFGNVRVNLGNGKNIDEKAARIKTLLPSLADKSGTLYMEDYTNESTHISFIKDKE